MEEADDLTEVTEKELLLEIFREIRTIKRFLIVWFVAVPVLVVLLIGVWTATDTRSDRRSMTSTTEPGDCPAWTTCGDSGAAG